MIHFTDERLYAKGTAGVTCRDRKTGDILYYTNKAQTANMNTGVSDGIIRADLGNSVAAAIPSDATFTVEVSAADFSMWAKTAQTGGTLKYSAPTIVCQNVTAESAALAISVANGTPVAGVGLSRVCCYVQEVGAASLVSVGGKAYDINPTTGAITGFTAETGKTYKVWYFVNRADAQIATITTMMDPKVVHFTAEIAVYANKSGTAKNEGTRVGSLYVIAPNMKFGANGGVVGDQTNPDTTSLSGQAMAYDPDVVSGTCDACSGSGAVLAYYLYVPCEESEADYQGIVAQIGGVITMGQSATQQVKPKAVMANGQLVDLAPGKCSYQVSGVTGLTVSPTGLLTSGTTAGDADLVVSFTAGSKTFTDQCTVTVTA